MDHGIKAIIWMFLTTFLAFIFGKEMMGLGLSIITAAIIISVSKD